MSESESESIHLLSSSEDESVEEVDAHLEKMITSKPLYYILAQYLETADGKNLAECVTDLTAAVKSLETVIASLKK